MKTLNRAELLEEFHEIMGKEFHHDHEIVQDKHGTIRWKADPFIVRLINDCSLNKIIEGFHENGNNKNTECYRELYRKMGYSLRGYWEVFYWDVNNPIADKYTQPEKKT